VGKPEALTETTPIRYVLLEDLPGYKLVKGDTFKLTEGGRTIQAEKQGNETLFVASIVNDHPKQWERIEN